MEGMELKICVQCSALLVFTGYTGHGRLHVMSCYAPTRTVNSM